MYIIGGRHKRQKLYPLKGDQTRPTTGLVREALFNICQQDVEEAVFLDLFSGSGAMGLEALSRGAREVVFMEGHRQALSVLKRNVAKLDKEGICTVLEGDLFRKLPRMQKRFDLIYADPPYNQGEGERVLQMIDSLDLLIEAGRLFIEEASEVLLEKTELNHLTFVRKKRFGRSTLFEFGIG